MSEDAYDKVTDALADVAERAVDYADVVRSAVERNAAGTYAAKDYLVDLQTLWGMSIRDAARVGSAMVEVMAPLVPTDVFEGDGGS